MGFHVTDFVKVDDLAMTFEVRLQLLMKWNDPLIDVEAFPAGEDTRIVPQNTLGKSETRQKN